MIYYATDNEEWAERLVALLGALRFDFERLPSLAAQVDARIEEMGEGLDDEHAAVMHAMLVTDDAESVARMLKMPLGLAQARECSVCSTLGVRGRVDLLRRLAGLEASDGRSYRRAG